MQAPITTTPVIRIQETPAPAIQTPEIITLVIITQVIIIPEAIPTE
jgi:hypothetical protein